MEEIKEEKCKCNCHATGGGFYGLAFIGALVFYMQNVHSFLEGVMGFLKALVWPAILTYKLFEFLVK